MRGYYGIVLVSILALSAGIIARYMLLYHTERNSPLLFSLAAVTGLAGACGFRVPAPV